MPTLEPRTPTPLPPTASPTTPTPSNAEREEELLSRVRWRSGNGRPVFAYHVLQPPLLDGVLDEWSGSAYAVDRPVFKPESWGGLDDLSATAYFSWDEDFLYMGLDVRDDRHVQPSAGKNLYKGDDVEIQTDANLSGDFNDKNLSADDGQVGIGVRNLSTGEYLAYRWRPPAVEGPLDVNAAARPTPRGYVLEVAWPWRAVNLTPRTEVPFGFCLSLTDDDVPGSAVQESMVSNCPKRQFVDPSTWGTLILVDW